jgi:hypothetical protein
VARFCTTSADIRQPPSTLRTRAVMIATAYCPGSRRLLRATKTLIEIDAFEATQIRCRRETFDRSSKDDRNDHRVHPLDELLLNSFFRRGEWDAGSPSHPSYDVRRRKGAPIPYPVPRR